MLGYGNGKNFNKRYPYIGEALADLPPETVVDGEVVALDDFGRPDFHRLQHYGAEGSRILYFIFDLLILNGRDLTNLPLTERRKLMKSVNLRSPRIRISAQFDIPAQAMLSPVPKQGPEAAVSKRKDSSSQPAHRTAPS